MSSLTRYAAEAQPVNPSERRRTRSQLPSTLDSNASTISFLRKKPMAGKLVPGPSHTFKVPALTRYRFPEGSGGIGSVGKGTLKRRANACASPLK